jgi:hypothetical protein
MPAQIDDIIYGKDKKIDFKKFNIGSLTKAVTFDLEEFGERGVQGVAVKTQDAQNTIKYCEAKGLKSPYIMAGLCKKDLVLVVRDGTDKNFEQMAVLVKGYADIKAKLAGNTAAVVNMDKGDATIDNASRLQANKFDTTVQDKQDSDFGDVTGNILLCAHGDPKVNVGRVIGVNLGGMTATQVADLLTKKGDKSKRLAKDYDGKITLSGCFTASGGPEALKADDPFAKKVSDELKKRGFTKCSVVGIPGVAMTADKGEKDDDGKRMKEGDKAAWVRSEEMLEALDKKAKVLRDEIDKLTDGVIEAGKKVSGDKSAFLGSPKVKAILGVIAQKQEALNSLKGEMTSIQADQAKYGDVDGKLMAHVTGTFGLRVIQASLGSAR